MNGSTLLWRCAAHLTHRPAVCISCQDLLCALLLSECVYKVAGSGTAAALQALTEFREHFPQGSLSLAEVQFCRRRVGHRCVTEMMER